MNEANSGLESLNLSNCITIGQGVKFDGSIIAVGKAFINGKVTGELSVDNLQVGEYGVIKGKIKSREMDIHGEVHEEVTCSEHLVVRSSGLISGMLTYGELEIQKGGRITGDMEQVTSVSPLVKHK